MPNTPPPPFRATIEESLSIPDLDSDQRSTSSSTQRRWDDPPEEAPPPSLHHSHSNQQQQPLEPQIENITTMVFLKTVFHKHPFNSEICQLQFSPTGTHLAVLIPRTLNIRTFHPDEPASIHMISVKDGARSQLLLNANGLKASAGFALRPGPDLVIACPFYAKGDSEASYTLPRIEVYDYLRKMRWTKHDVTLRAPVVFSPDGTMLAGVSTRDSSRIVLAAVSRQSVTVKTMVLKHTDEVTKLAFLPDGTKLVSCGRDGFVRITSLESGRTLNRIEIGGRAHASILEVAPDGTKVVSVWGRDVVIWDLSATGGSGGVHTYNLNAVRGNGTNEGWPLAVSPDCRYIACRTEEGFDVSDVDTGRFRGDFATAGSVITCATFTKDGKKIAVGNYEGVIQVYDVITV
ncbi:guanine nucleotide-binding protein subunit beta-like protein [Cladorrhinum sp. PSN259]|nr:guanine nucleotide-binding protein subunit beta-like protein [Cladorrhinum sp. PSN259]